MSNTNTDVENMTAFSKKVFESALNTVESMQNGERMQIKQLAQVVSKLMSKEAKEVLGFVSHFAHNTSIAYVTRGKNGGLVRGTRPAKVVKVSKKALKNAAAVTTVSSDPNQ